jgi:4-hydroxybenzoate polyprenyltransferase
MLFQLLKAMRPKQWMKNGLVFAALVFDQQLLILEPFLRTVAGFFLLSLGASSIYLINDIADLDQDRQHPTKRFRPLASGALSVRVGQMAAVILFVLSLGLGFALNRWVSLVTVQRFSPWLYVCTTLLALFMGLGKRRAELVLLADAANSHRRVLDGYTLTFLDQLIVIVSSSTIMAYSLYTFSAANLPTNNLMMLTIPFVIYGIFRYLYLVNVENSGGAPEELVLSDWPLLTTFVLWGLTAILILYLGT